MLQPQIDPYYLLGIQLNATPDEIRAAYRRRATERHPDRQPPEQRPQASEEMKALNAARDFLLDPVRRADYDTKMRLEMQKAMWRAQRDAYTPPQPMDDPVHSRRRSQSFWYSGGFVLIFFMFLLMAPFFLTLPSVSADASGPLGLLMGALRCVGGLILLGVLLPVTAYILALFAHSLRR
jgi:hypothetical protein